MTTSQIAPPDWLRWLGRPVRDLRRHRGQLDEDRASWKTEWRIERELDDLTRGSHPVIVGPWLSEVGYEALYWVPFLRWVREAFRLSPDRVVAVSRGGVASWYAGIAHRYAEIWDEVSPETYASRTRERGQVKQLEIAPFDREIVGAVERRLGLTGARVLHPSVMYRLFSLFWSGQRSLGFIDRHTRYERIDAPPLPTDAALPSRYVAVKLYAARALPDTSGIRSLLARHITALAEQAPVVLLDTGLVLDEHTDYDVTVGDRILSAKAWMTPSTNLGVQTALIAHAAAYVGTCGSLAWLAPMLGVNTSALFVDPKWLHAHLGVALRAVHRAGAARFAAADLRAVHPLAEL
jgi:hypothetical protein